MKDKAFIDTNVFVYSLELAEPKKQQIAVALVKTADIKKEMVISSQVVQEFLNIALKKFKHTFNNYDLQVYLGETLMPLCKHYPHANFYTDVLQIQNGYQLSWYDAMIVAAALELDCDLLYSEDLQDGQEIMGLKIVNPFSDLI